jgi:DNA-binding response OmpR family regulator
MTELHILLADNDPDFVTLVTEFLESQGYRVIPAANAEEARELLLTRRVHLALLDMRLTNNEDENDRSGLTLAKEVAVAIPKLIMTQWPTYRDVREAMRLDETPLPPAVDFLFKEEGLKRLGAAVAEAFDRYVRLDRDLLIRTNENNPVTFPQLSALVSGDDATLLPSAAEELEDLYRRLFYGKQQIKLERMLWRREARVALMVHAFADGAVNESMVVVCGRKEYVTDEVRRYRDAAPKAPGHSATVLSATAETARFAANAYALADYSHGELLNLAELYRVAADRVFSAVVTSLFEQTLAEWHSVMGMPADGRSLANAYCEPLGFDLSDGASHELDERITALARQFPLLGGDAQVEDGKLRVRLGERTFSYPMPGEALERLREPGKPVLLGRAPGSLTGENILTDGHGRAWLTDFGAAGLAPTIWNFIALEAAVRFDWVDTNNLTRLHEMEQLLTGDDFGVLSASDIEQPLRKPVRTIRLIRRLASAAVSKGYLAYHAGVLLYAARRLTGLDREARLTASDLARHIHLLMAAALISARILHDTHGAGRSKARDGSGIRHNKDRQIVTVDGVRIPLRGQSYELLCHLLERPNELSTRRNLIESVFKEVFEETDESQASRLNTAIRRLREKIEENPDHPRFLLTEPYGGYRLIPHPGSRREP